MLKRVAFVMAILMMFAFTACGSPSITDSSAGTSSEAPDNNKQEDISTPESSQSEASESSKSSESNEVATNENKILIAYFSSAGNIVTDEEAKGNIGHGNTKTIAELIQGQVGGDLFFIETVDKYPANYNDTIDIAMQEQRANARPALATHVENMGDYDVIFLGYPNWWGTLPQPVLTFLNEYDFSGKTVIPFCTHEGSGLGRSIGDLESALPDATLLEGFAVRGGSAVNAGDDVNRWLSELDLEL